MSVYKNDVLSPQVNPSIGEQEDVALTVKSGVSMIKGALGETLS